MVEILLANGADESAKNSDGQVPKDCIVVAQKEAVAPVSPTPLVVVVADTADAPAESPRSKPRVSKFLAGFGHENDTDPVVSQVSAPADK